MTHLHCRIPSTPRLVLAGVAPRLVLAGVALGLALASPASAWEVYARGGFAISTGEADVAATLDIFPGEVFASSDSDTSPAIGGGVGIVVPWSQLTPWSRIGSWRLPDWPIRFETEAMGLRQYDWLTEGASDTTPFLTQVDSWTLFQNFWFDFPIGGIYRPISKIKGVGHRPGLRRTLDRFSIYMGAGVGIAGIHVESADNASSIGQDDFLNFAWQAGTGLGYELMKAVDLEVGYRYVDEGKVNLDISGTAGAGNVRIRQQFHEFTAGIRVQFYTIPYPWRRI